MRSESGMKPTGMRLIESENNAPFWSVYADLRSRLGPDRAVARALAITSVTLRKYKSLAGIREAIRLPDGTVVDL